jgi:hypothetical protein
LALWALNADHKTRRAASIDEEGEEQMQTAAVTFDRSQARALFEEA